MRYSHYMIVTRPTLTADGLGGYTQSSPAHVYSNWCDWQDVAEMFVSRTGTLISEGDAKVFLPDTLSDSGIRVSDKVQLGLRADVLVDDSGTPLEAANGAWLTESLTTTQKAVVEKLRRLDDKILVKYSEDRTTPLPSGAGAGMQTQGGVTIQTQDGQDMEIQ